MKINKIIIILNFILFTNIFIDLSSFNTLQEIETYSKKKVEYPKIDNNNYVYPNFNLFFKQESIGIISGFIYNLLDSFNLRRELWSSKKFKTLITNIIKQREKNFYKDNFILKIKPKGKTNLVIWSDLLGAFHSLTRDLIKLKNMGYINDKLEIIKPDTYFVFNGNVIGQSAYNLEILTIILNLLEKNPNKVFYIKGFYETAYHWENTTLKNEIYFKFNDLLFQSTLPIEQNINSFFNTLPLAIYLNIGTPTKQSFLRISHFGRDYPDLNESYFSEFLKVDTENIIDLFNLSDKKFSNESIDIEVIIKGKDRN